MEMRSKKGERCWANNDQWNVWPLVGQGEGERGKGSTLLHEAPHNTYTTRALIHCLTAAAGAVADLTSQVCTSSRDGLTNGLTTLARIAAQRGTRRPAHTIVALGLFHVQAFRDSHNFPSARSTLDENCWQRLRLRARHRTHIAHSFLPERVRWWTRASFFHFSESFSR